MSLYTCGADLRKSRYAASSQRDRKGFLRNCLRSLPVMAVSAALFVLISIAKAYSLCPSVSLPDCNDSTIGTAQPGNNCLFKINACILPLCQSIPGATYSVSASSVLSNGTTAAHRSNCADLSDLPLCSQMNGSTSPIKNCVKECSDSSITCSGNQVRGTDCAVHNRDCIRFCDAPESGVTANSGVNCTSRKCHQLADGVSPNPPNNCELTTCNLLTTDELNKTKFSYDSTSYCDGSSVKCFLFTLDQLPSVKFRANNTMCQIHNCRTSSETCIPYANDEVQQIINQGQDYQNAYQGYINGGYAVTSTLVCTPTSCKPIVQRPYRCQPFDAANPTTPNSQCDSSENGNSCSGGFCYETIDCNQTANANEPECNSAPSESGVIGSADDTMKSWFYRPQPLGKSMNGSVLKEMTTRSGNGSDSLCYTEGQMYDQNGWGWYWPSLLGGGYMHDYIGMDSRSPGKCDANPIGSRGVGYGNVCGVHWWVYNKPTDYAGFHMGYVRTNYVEGDGTHKLTVCLRFQNWMDPAKTCGSRECSISCAWGLCSQICGSDKCLDLTVNDSNPQECAMSQDLFDNHGNNGCLDDIDTYMRIRAVKYGRYICTFLDLKGTLAYNPQYFDGTEKLSDGTCIAGTSVNGTCNGKNTNDSAGLADVWRTVMRIPYIQNNRPDGQPQGYLDQNGQLFLEQECISVPFRIPTPRLYNLANMVNSSNLFGPPLYILNSQIKRGGVVSIGTPTEPLGPTDFHYPEIEVKFGLTSAKLSLGLGYSGYEDSGGDPNGSMTITTNITGFNFNYSAEIFVRKESDQNSNQPLFCLYRRIKDESGAYVDPMSIGCVKRNFPEIDNSGLKNITPAIDFRKAVIYPDSTNTYDDSQIALRYLSSADIVDSCDSNGASCTTELTLNNPDPSLPTCDSTIEKYQVCAQREDCSRLNVECIDNEISLHNAQLANQPVDSFLAIRKNCNEVLLSICNQKKGLPTSQDASITNQNPGGATPDPSAYGWFNEICISTGFEPKLSQIIAYQTTSGVRGKCLVDPSSPYLTDNDPNTNCSDGGKAPNCLCTESVAGVDPGAGYMIRQKTPHEAGLCVDMPLPQLCPQINYNQSPNPDPNDPDYILTSLNQMSYGATVTDINNLVHISHEYRTFGSASNPVIPLKGHAQFPASIFGLNDIGGECRGFWRQQMSSAGISLTPKLSCLNNNGTAAWETDARNPCIRYQCPNASTSDPDTNGNYPGGYVLYSESGENKGFSNGFAIWASLTKTNDFMENATALSCITGFTNVGATAVLSNGESDVNHAALYAHITGYSGGTLPTRNCNQLGQWQTVNNICQRITCPAITPPTPANSSDTASWELWKNSGGATFPSVNASRSVNNIQPESVASGTCNSNLGFFQAPGGNPPTRSCDYLGNWGNVVNPCVTQCDAVSNPVMASSSNNGFGFWSEVDNVPLSSAADGTFNGCVSGYYPYPYPPLRTKYGVSYSLVDSGYDYSTSIPRDLANDNRQAGNPQRVCQSVVTAGQANVWTVPSSSCINSCVGFDSDPRLGAGKTKHSTLAGGIELSWPSTNFGQWAYIDNPNINQQDASQYYSGRTNGYYSMARYCNPNTHKWDNPIAQCATNNGVIPGSNATYNSPTPRIAVGSQTGKGVCLSGYYGDNQGTAPVAQYTCTGSNGSNNIDQVYFNLTNGANCKSYCTITSGQTFATYSQYNGPTGLINVGTQVQLVCAAGAGNMIIGGSRSGVPYNCGQSPSDRSTSNPYILCQNGGTWSGVYNPCSACRNCPPGSPISGTTDINLRIHCCTAGCNWQCDNLQTACGDSACIDASWTEYENFYSGVDNQNLPNGNSAQIDITTDGQYCGLTVSNSYGYGHISFQCGDGTKYITNLWQDQDW